MTATLTATLPGGEISQTCTMDATGQWPLCTDNTIGWLQATPTNLTGTLIWFTPAGTNQLINVRGVPGQPK